MTISSTDYVDHQNAANPASPQAISERQAVVKACPFLTDWQKETLCELLSKSTSFDAQFDISNRADLAPFIRACQLRGLIQLVPYNQHVIRTTMVKTPRFRIEPTRFILADGAFAAEGVPNYSAAGNPERGPLWFVTVMANRDSDIPPGIYRSYGETEAAAINNLCSHFRIERRFVEFFAQCQGAPAGPVVVATTTTPEPSGPVKLVPVQRDLWNRSEEELKPIDVGNGVKIVPYRP